MLTSHHPRSVAILHSMYLRSRNTELGTGCTEGKLELIFWAGWENHSSPYKSIQITLWITSHRADSLWVLASAAEANISGSTCMPSRQTDRSPTTSVWSLSALSCRVCTTSETDIQERRVERYGMHATHTCAHTQACKHAHTYTQACKHVHAHASL